MSQATFTAHRSSYASVPKHRVWLFRSIKKNVLNVGRAFDHKGEVLEVTGLPARIFVFRHPDHIGKILKHPEVGDRKYVRMLPRVKWVMDRGGYILEGGNQWRDRRRTTQKGFRSPCLRAYAEQIPLLVTTMLDEWERSISRGTEFDVCPGLQRLITHANFRMFFSHDLKEPELSQVVRDTHFVQLNFVRVSPLSVPLPSNLHFRRCVERLRKKMASLVATRRKQPGQCEDLLSVLLEAGDQHGWSESELIGEIFSVYFGAAVVATTLTWTLYLLGSHPKVQQQVIDEIRVTLDGQSPTVCDLTNLPYTQAVMQEVIRLYPPSWGYPRYCEHGMEIDRYEIPSDSMVIPMVYFTHRHPDFWPDPELFLPGRFLDSATKEIHPFSHLPFGGGPRICLGAQLAPMIIKLALAGIFQKYRLEFQPRFEGDPLASFGFEIHPNDNVRMIAKQIA